MSGERITQSEFARRNGWTRQYVAKLIKQGRISLEGRRIDPVAAKRAIDNLSEPSTELRKRPVAKAVQGHTTGAAFIPQSVSASPPTDGRKAVDYASARTMREAYRAKMARLDYEERKGKLVDAQKMYEEGFQPGRQIRDALLGIPDRMADILAAEPDPARVRQLLHDELTQALTELTRA